MSETDKVFRKEEDIPKHDDPENKDDSASTAQNEVIAKNLSAMQKGNIAGHHLGLLEEIFREMEDGIKKKMFGLLDKLPAVDPQITQQAWLEMHTIHKLRRELAQQQRKGQSASRALTPHM